MKLLQVQKLERFSPDLISVSSVFKEEEKEVARLQWCFTREESFPKDASRVFLCFQGDSHFVQETYVKFIKEEFWTRLKRLEYVSQKQEVYLKDSLKFFWGVTVKVRLSMFEHNMWPLVVLYILYYFGSLLLFLFKKIFVHESPLLIMSETTNSTHHIAEEVKEMLRSLEEQLLMQYN